MREKYEKHKRAMKLLASGKDEIERNIPMGSGTGNAGNTSVISNLKRLIEEVLSTDSINRVIEVMVILWCALRSKQSKLNETLLSRN